MAPDRTVAHHGIETGAGLVERDNIPSPAAPHVPYFTPAQRPIAGTALDLQSAPKLFHPWKIRGLEVQNRIIVCLSLFHTFPHYPLQLLGRADR